MPIDDPPEYPKLDFKPIMLQEWVLATTLIFYIGVMGMVGMLLFYENQSRIFHVRATASRFTIRFLPSIIGALTNIIYTATWKTYARTLPYMEMADTTITDSCAVNAAKTMIAAYFPRVNIIHALRNRHWLLVTMTICSLLVSQVLLPVKGSLLTKNPSNNGTGWDVTIWPFGAIVTIIVYSSLVVTTAVLLIVMWKRRTGLKWDVVSIADYCVLFNKSNVLDHYAMISIETPVHKWRDSIECSDHLYRLGYWRVERTNEIWHGVRRTNRSSTRENYWSVTTNGKSPTASSVTFLTNIDITSQHTHNFLVHPRSCYRLAFSEVVSIVWHILSYIFAVSLSVVATYLLFSDRYKEGFEVRGYSVTQLSFITRFLPACGVAAFSIYWNDTDVYYRLIQPFMGLRQPSPVDQNLLLEYSTTLPVLTTFTALRAKHWRLALFTAMSLVNKLFVVFVGSLIVIAPSEKIPNGHHIGFSYGAFMACLSFVLAYLVLIPYAWPGLDRRLPWLPASISAWLYFFHASSLTANDAFRPRRTKEERWQMISRLRLQEQLYAFGIYPGRDGAVHLGIESAYSYVPEKVRIVVPILPPRRLHQRWLRRVQYWILRLCRKDLPPDQKQEELDTIQEYMNRSSAWTAGTCQCNQCQQASRESETPSEVELQELHRPTSNDSAFAENDVLEPLLSDDARAEWLTRHNVPNHVRRRSTA